MRNMVSRSGWLVWILEARGDVGVVGVFSFLFFSSSVSFLQFLLCFSDIV